MSLGIRCRFVRARFELCVNLDVAPGEVVALHGPNGSGKSTLLHLVTGLLPVDEGTITIGDAIVDRVSAGDATVFVQPEHRGVGLLPQGGALFPHMSAQENVAFGPRARGVTVNVAAATAGTQLQRFGIVDLGQRRPHQLSGGQRQRVALARTLAVEPRVLLLDEPTSALDERGRSEVLEMLSEVKRTFAGSMVLVSHDRRDIEALADRVVGVEQRIAGAAVHSRFG